MENKDLALLTVLPKKLDQKHDGLYMKRLWQGIPGIERTRKGRLYATFYSGGKGEGSENFVLLLKSDDNGLTWSDPLYVIDPPDKVRAFDPCLWIDPLGRLWWFWSQSYTLYDGRAGVWASVMENPDDDDAAWSTPIRICHGIMINKPTILSTGEWLFPCAVWKCRDSEFNRLEEERFSNVYISDDQGKTFRLQGRADVPDRAFDEHMIVEKKDGSLWMLVRTKYGIGESYSFDKGKTWTPGRDSGLGGPNSRFFIRRLQSGNLLLVNHLNFTGRSHLTAMLSEDDGMTWKYKITIDERSQVSYPDGVQAEDGTVYIIYDRERYDAKEILMAVITEEDIRQGRRISQNSRGPHQRYSPYFGSQSKRCGKGESKQHFIRFVRSVNFEREQNSSNFRQFGSPYCPTRPCRRSFGNEGATERITYRQTKSSHRCYRNDIRISPQCYGGCGRVMH
jgi:hypothetical protein